MTVPLAVSAGMRADAATRGLRGAGGALVLFLVLEAVSRSGIVSPAFLPPASVVGLTTLRLLIDPAFLVEVGGTLAGWGVGLAAATVVGVSVGLLLGSSPASYRASLAAIEFLRPIPSVALIPLAVLIAGRGLEMKAGLAAFAAVWPILLNTVHGLREVDPIAADTARAFGLGEWRVAWHVRLPSAAPFAFTGVRIGAAVALVVVISTELIVGGSAGIGSWMLARSTSGVERELVYAAVVVAGLLGLAINLGLSRLERGAFAWFASARAPA